MALYGVGHMVESFSEKLKDMNEEAEKSGRKLGAGDYIQAFVNSIPVVGTLTKGISTLWGELDGSAKAAREFAREMEHWKKVDAIIQKVSAEIEQLKGKTEHARVAMAKLRTPEGKGDLATEIAVGCGGH